MGTSFIFVGFFCSLFVFYVSMLCAARELPLSVLCPLPVLPKTATPVQMADAPNLCMSDNHINDMNDCSDNNV